MINISMSRIVDMTDNARIAATKNVFAHLEAQLYFVPSYTKRRVTKRRKTIEETNRNMKLQNRLYREKNTVQRQRVSYYLIVHFES